jgi:hypothetical protein
MIFIITTKKVSCSFCHFSKWEKKFIVELLLPKENLLCDIWWKLERMSYIALATFHKGTTYSQRHLVDTGENSLWSLQSNKDVISEIPHRQLTYYMVHWKLRRLIYKSEICVFFKIILKTELANYFVKRAVSFTVYFGNKLPSESKKMCSFSDKCLWFNIRKENGHSFLQEPGNTLSSSNNSFFKWFNVLSPCRRKFVLCRAPSSGV